MARCDVVIVGAGPYGLAAASHLRTLKGLEVRIFGEPMSFWDRHMPRGMLLRSAWTATHIADPCGSLTLEAFQRATDQRFCRPVPLERFVAYGLWYQRQAIPEVDRREVVRVDSCSKGFQVELQDGEVISCGRLIVAVGIAAFAWRPIVFEGLPSGLASHTSEHRDLSRFGGKRVLVVGGGQSALESGALLHEAGADVEIVARSGRIHWLQGFASTMLHRKLGTVVSRLLYAPTDVGPAGLSQLLARPDLLKRLPRRVQDRLRRRAVRPAGAGWLVNRLRDVPLTSGRMVVSVSILNGRAQVRLSDQSERIVDHILLGTGYRVDVSKYSFLSPGILKLVEQTNGYPVLKKGLETSVPGLHILGAPAVWSFGPLLQFVSGAGYAARAVLHSVCDSRHQTLGRES